MSALFIIGWIVAGVIALAVMLYTASRLADVITVSDCAIAAFFSLLGPIALCSALMVLAFAVDGPVLWRRK